MLKTNRNLTKLALLVFATIFSNPSYSEEPTDIKTIKGECLEQSHISEGKIGEDLTKRQSRFFCDAAVMAFFDHSNQHIMIQFTESKSHTNTILGYAGYMDTDGQILNVNKVYIGNTAYPVEEGFCKLFFKKKHIDSMSCGAPVDEGDRRTVPVVVFQAKPGQ